MTSFICPFLSITSIIGYAGYRTDKMIAQYYAALVFQLIYQQIFREVFDMIGYENLRVNNLG